MENSKREFTCNDCQEVSTVDWSKIRPDLDDGTSNLEIHQDGDTYAYYGECQNCGNLVKVEPPVPQLKVSNVDVAKDGIAVEIEDTITQRTLWIDVYKDTDGEWTYEFNQYIFNYDNENDIVTKLFQEELNSYAEEMWSLVEEVLDDYEDDYNKLQEKLNSKTMRTRLKEIKTDINAEVENKELKEDVNSNIVWTTEDDDDEDYDDDWDIKKEDLEENVLPLIDKQLNDDILILAGYYGSNYPEYKSSGNGGKLFKGTDDFEDYMSDFDVVRITSDKGVLGATLSDHDGTVSGSFYTLPADKTELIKALGYADIIKDRYDEEDLDEYNEEDLMETEFNSDLLYDGLDAQDFTNHMDLLVPIKDTISGYALTDLDKTKTESKENNSVEELLDLLDKVNITNKQRAFCEFTGISKAQLDGSQGFNEENAKIFIPKVKEWLSKQESVNVLNCNNIKKVEAVEYISKQDYDKIPNDYKTTIAQTLKARQVVGDNVDELRKLYKDLGYDETDPMILTHEGGGSILKPVKVKKTESAALDGEDLTNTFKNYKAFEANFEPIKIVKNSYDKNYKVYRANEEDANNYIYYANNKDNIEGWLYGAVQATNGVFKKLTNKNEAVNKNILNEDDEETLDEAINRAHQEEISAIDTYDTILSKTDDTTDIKLIDMIKEIRADEEEHKKLLQHYKETGEALTDEELEALENNDTNNEDVEEEDTTTDDIVEENKSVKIEEDNDNMYYYEVHFDYTADSGKDSDGYSKFFKSNVNTDDFDEIINLADDAGVLDEDDKADFDYIDIAQQIDKDEYIDAMGTDVENVATKVSKMDTVELIIELEGGELNITDVADWNAVKNVAIDLSKSQGSYGRLLRDMNAMEAEYGGVENLPFPISM